jgi:hypothetical protein
VLKTSLKSYQCQPIPQSHVTPKALQWIIVTKSACDDIGIEHGSVHSMTDCTRTTRMDGSGLLLSFHSKKSDFICQACLQQIIEHQAPANFR